LFSALACESRGRSHCRCRVRSPRRCRRTRSACPQLRRALASRHQTWTVRLFWLMRASSWKKR
jgi:hypothetical protein